MASGRPSSLRQISVTVSALSAVIRNSGLVLRARSLNSSIASSARDREGTRQLTSPVTPIGSRLVVSRVSAGQAPNRAMINSALESSRCSQLSSSISIWRSRMNRSSTSIVCWPGWSGRPSARATVTGTTSGLVIDARSTYQTPSANSVGHGGGDLYRQARLARAARAGQRDEPVLGERLADAAHFGLASDEARQLHRKMLGGNGIGGAQGREVVVQDQDGTAGPPVPGEGDRAADGEPRSVSVTSGGSWSTTRGSVAPESTVWPPWREVAQPCGAVDRRADVVSLVAQHHVAGVHADAQLDRRQRRTLQLQRACHRVGGAGERDDEAVALTLLDGPHTVVGWRRVGQGLVEARDGGLHRLGLGFPQPRRTFDVGQQQRDRSSRKLTHVRPMSGSLQLVSLMLASMR